MWPSLLLQKSSNFIWSDDLRMARSRKGTPFFLCQTQANWACPKKQPINKDIPPNICILNVLVVTEIGGGVAPCPLPYEVFPARSWISAHQGHHPLQAPVGASGKCAMPAPKPQARTQQQVKQGISNFRSRIPQIDDPQKKKQHSGHSYAGSHTQVEGKKSKAVI